MVHGSQSLKSIHSLDVLLSDRKIGTIVRSPVYTFQFEDDYRAAGGSPILSLSFRSPTGRLRTPKPLAGILPPYFANLLPEGRLREAMERHHPTARRRNDFDLLAILGADLSGAVQVLPSDGPHLDERPKARFSLAGVQLKLSVTRNTKTGALSLPMDGTLGRYIAKFPPAAFPGLSENEFANLALAAAIGMEVPAHELVEESKFEELPEEFTMRSERKVLLVKRFDRSPIGQRIHVEDFAQVFGIHPSRKYEGAAFHDVAAILNGAVSPSAALEFVRRLALAALTGNGDMHLKNWSLIYAEDGDTPALAPVYDVLSTVPYIPTDAMALSLGKERSFKALTASRWKTFASRAALTEMAVLAAVVETVTLVNERWWRLPEREVVPAMVLERIDEHIKVMTRILGTCSET
ncbi:HipA domain-containing protein [Mesorhizobium sp. WSM4976]|uniref:type II toxin-antitoxin system HipA family toxin n=1 Tax=Mesorhizobium sp. WSM4976 TaxID=3038549 RepID=UPI00241596F0|nr:HipA domain-containing protein [Mesorhizobium sp. WSM4976]MDG4896999.1 HipA domain-containing protein [Mesorhizobium sp. WSM4976]